MAFSNNFNSLPAHPRHLTTKAEGYRERFVEPPGLDDKGLMPGNLLAAFKGAARYMCLRGNIIVAVDYLFGLTRPQDWTGNARPIVWPSAREQSEALGLSPSGVKLLNRRLIELGLIIAKDSPTGARWGRRGHNGQIIEAYGFDLTPMAHRVGEFAEIRDAGRADDAIRAQLRRRKTVAIKSIGQIVRTAAEQNFDTPELYALAERSFTMTEGLAASADRQTLLGVVDALEKLNAAVFALYRTLVRTRTAVDKSNDIPRKSAMEIVKNDCAGTLYRPPNNNYKPTNNPLDSNSLENTSSEFEKNRAQLAPKDREMGGDFKLPTVRPKEVVRLAPAFATYMGQDLDRLDDDRAIMATIRAAEAVAFKELGVSPSLWREAQQVLGGWPATLAVMVVAAKDQDYFSRTAAHYFAGMVSKAKNGTLRLDRSIWGLRTRMESFGGNA